MSYLSEIEGDLFIDSPSEAAFVHCISEDISLGKGIALQFRRKFNKISELKAQKVRTGGVAVIRLPNRIIYNLVTKKNAWDKPLLSDLKNSLITCRNFSLSDGIKILAMPRIGCGLDGLNWEKQVKPMLEEVFENTNIKILVVNLKMRGEAHLFQQS